MHLHLHYYSLITDGEVGGETLRRKMHSHQVTKSEPLCDRQNETLLPTGSWKAWRACQLALVCFKLGANKDVLLGICLHDSKAERESLISYGGYRDLHLKLKCKSQIFSRHDAFWSKTEKTLSRSQTSHHWQKRDAFHVSTNHWANIDITHILLRYPWQPE